MKRRNNKERRNKKTVYAITLSLKQTQVTCIDTNQSTQNQSDYELYPVNYITLELGFTHF